MTSPLHVWRWIVTYLFADRPNRLTRRSAHDWDPK